MRTGALPAWFKTKLPWPRQGRDGLTCIVFSRDRSMQLDAFLQSVRRHVPDLFEEIRVIYRATDESFLRGYDRLRQEWPEVGFERESDFQEDVRRAIAHAGNRVVFHTDDDVYFASVPEFDLGLDLVCFSLRLGLNTTYCYPLDFDEQVRSPIVEADVVSWYWGDQEPQGAYGYPLALNAHAFRTSDVRGWLRRSRFRNPNELEVALQAFRDEIPPRIASFRHSKVVNIPVNLVNEVFPNRHASAYSPADLNARFLRGERIDLGGMDFSRVTACHQEIPLAFATPR